MWELSRTERKGYRGGPGSDGTGEARPAGHCHGRAFHRDAVRTGDQAEVGGRRFPGDDWEEGRQERGALRSFKESPGEEGSSAGGYRLVEQKRYVEEPA